MVSNPCLAHIELCNDVMRDFTERDKITAARGMKYSADGEEVNDRTGCLLSIFM